MLKHNNVIVLHISMNVINCTLRLILLNMDIYIIIIYIIEYLCNLYFKQSEDYNDNMYFKFIVFFLRNFETTDNYEI